MLLNNLKRKFKSLALIGIGGLTTYTAINVFTYGSTYKTIILPIFQLFDPETSHDFVINILKYHQIVPEIKMENNRILESEFCDKKIENPFGLSAGFDKNAKAINGFAKFGFSFIEIGSVTKDPQPGNSKPRIFRFNKDKAIVNSCGFNSDGFEDVYKNIIEAKNNGVTKLIGVNLGVNKNSSNVIKDYTEGIKKFQNVADYFVINISSPNTAGLRDLHEISKLQTLLKSINEIKKEFNTSVHIPLFLKLSPDLSFDQLNEIAHTITNIPECKIDGLIISNTSNNPTLLNKYGKNTGGLSGKPLFDKSTKMLNDMYKLTNGRVYLIASGGVFSGRDAYEKIIAGANLVEIYSGLIFEGPFIVKKCESELIEILKENGYNSIKDAIGSKHV